VLPATDGGHRAQQPENIRIHPSLSGRSEGRVRIRLSVEQTRDILPGPLDTLTDDHVAKWLSSQKALEPARCVASQDEGRARGTAIW